MPLGGEGFDLGAEKNTFSKPTAYAAKGRPIPTGYWRSNPGLHREIKNQINSGFYLAEGEGFEPSRACAQHAFQACAIGH